MRRKHRDRRQTRADAFARDLPIFLLAVLAVSLGFWSTGCSEMGSQPAGQLDHDHLSSCQTESGTNPGGLRDH